MRREMGCHRDAAHLEGGVTLQRRKIERARHELLKDISCIQHAAHWLHTFSRQMHREITRALIQPKSLHEHEKTAHMIAVQMAQNNAIEVIGLHSGRAQPTAHRLTAVQQQRAVL